MILVTALLGAAFLLVAPQAHADNTSYLGDLNAAGVPVIAGQNQELIMGNQICTALHDGMTPAAASAGDFLPIQKPWGPQIVAAAQHNLCPDTLH